MKPERVSEIFIEFQPFNTIIRFSFYFSSFFLPPRLNIISLLKKLVKQVFKIASKLSSWQKREPPMIRVRLLKRRRREVKVDPKLGGQWKVPSLVANGRFQAWWPMEGSKLGGQWKVPSLVANGRFQAWWPIECSKLGGQWKVKEKPFSPLPFSPQQPLPKPSIFPFDLTILLYHGPKPLLTPSFPFLRSINYNCAPQCNQSSTPSLSP
jgi:hypothetical protein